MKLFAIIRKILRLVIQSADDLAAKHNKSIAVLLMLFLLGILIITLHILFIIGFIPPPSRRIWVISPLIILWSLSLLESAFFHLSARVDEMFN